MDEDQEHDKRAELLKLWREYGTTYNVSVTTEQPFLLYGTLNCRVPTTKVD